KIHEARIVASTPPACLDGIEGHTRARIAEHEFLWSSILLERAQFLKDDVVHRNRSSSPGLTSCDENSPSLKVHVFPLESENLAPPHASVKGNGDGGSDVVSSACELRKQSLLFFCGNEPFATRSLLQHANTPHWV